MNKSGRSTWCRTAELSDPADSETAKEAPHAEYVLHRARRSQENNQLLREGRQWPNPRGRHDSRHAIRSGFLDENTPAAMDGGDGSDDLHWLDLRSSAASRGGLEGGSSADAASHRSGEKEERSHRCQQ